MEVVVGRVKKLIMVWVHTASMDSRSRASSVTHAHLVRATSLGCSALEKEANFPAFDLHL